MDRSISIKSPRSLSKTTAQQVADASQRDLALLRNPAAQRSLPR